MAHWEQLLTTLSILFGIIDIYRRESIFQFDFSAVNDRPLMNNLSYRITPKVVDCSRHLMIIVTSTKRNLHQRMAIRSTWARRDRLMKNNATLIFLVGHDADSGSDSESSLFGDLLSDVSLDDEQSRTRHTISGLSWAITRCPAVPFIVKTNDDNFVHWPSLHRSVLGYLPSSSVIWGDSVVNEAPLRDPTVTTHFVSEKDFPLSIYPKYIKGPMYCMTNAAAVALTLAFSRTQTVGHSFPREDVFVTGLIASAAGIRRSHYVNFNCVWSPWIQDFAIALPFNNRSVVNPVNVIGLSSSQIRQAQEIFDEKQIPAVICGDKTLIGA